MRPRERRETGEQDLFRSRLDQIIDMDHALAKLARTVDWGFLEGRFGEVYTDDPGHPPLPTRLMAGLSILKHTYDLSDEMLCERWVENPYYQLCLSKIKAGHIGGAARRELGGKESARPVRRDARTAHPSPRRDVCGRHYNISCTTAAGGGGGIRRTRQRGRGIPGGSNRSVVRHTRFAMETVERSADRECPLIELVG
jgi:hypothetical protein